MSNQAPISQATSTPLHNVHRITLPTPFAVGDVNAYLAEGEPLTLIDAGVRIEACRAVLESALAERGYRLRDIQQVIVTHHHADHIGLVGDIVSESGAQVVAHRLTAPWLADFVNVRAANDGFYAQFFREQGVPEPYIIGMGAGNRVFNQFASPVAATRQLEDGDSVTFAGLVWQIYHTPGHAGDQICLYQPERQVLIASDHILPNISSNAFLEPPLATESARPKRLLQYRAALARIAALPIATALPGHGLPFGDVAILVAERLKAHHLRAEKILSLCDVPRTLYELARLTFPKAGDSEIFLILSEVIGHLDLLEAEGKIHTEARDDIMYWMP